MSATEKNPAGSEHQNDPPEQDEAVRAKDSNGSSDAADAGAGASSLHAHHVSKILDEVLEEPEESGSSGKFKHPMVLDIILAVGLLFAMGGFTVGLFKMYLTHSAEQSITQHNYKAAIAILKGAPVPGFFAIPGSDPDELLNQALYLDAMDKLEVDDDVDGALKEFQQIRPGSHFFTLAQEIIEENYTPSATTLQGGTSVTEQAAPVQENKPLLPEAPKDAVP